MALAVATDGRVAVLDQVNTRVLVLLPGQAPTQAEVIDLPRPTFQDLAWDQSGRLWALDCAGEPEVRALTGSAFSFPTLGDGVVEGTAVTGIFTAANGIWAETEHAALVHLIAADQTLPPERAVLPGRFGHDLERLRTVARVGERRVAVTALLPDGSRAFRRVIDLPLPVLGVREWDGTADGRTVVVIASALHDNERLVQERLTAVVLAPDGAELRRLELLPPDGVEEQFRPLKLAADGSLYQLRCTRAGAEVRRYTP